VVKEFTLYLLLFSHFARQMAMTIWLIVCPLHKLANPTEQQLLPGLLLQLKW